MRKINLSILFLLITVAFYAQKISGKIVNENNNAIGEARIGIENEEIGDVTDSNGNYTIDLTNIDQTKNVKVIENEYDTFKVAIFDFMKSQNHTIKLKKKIINLEPVVINSTKYKHKNFGTSNSKTSYSGFDSNDPNDTFKELAIKIKNKKKLKIKNININIVDYKFEKNATFFLTYKEKKMVFQMTQSL